MTQEQIEEVIKRDLSARYPYGVICEVKYWDSPSRTECTARLSLTDVGEVAATFECSFSQGGFLAVSYSKVKPYLRKMDSLSVEEQAEYMNYVVNEKDPMTRFCNELVFYGRHHIDYRNLIERELAILCDDENNPYPNTSPYFK